MTLSHTAKLFRKGVFVFAGILFAYYLFTLLVIPSSKNFIKGLFPKKDTSNPIYGMLDPLEFSEKTISNNTSNKPVYSLNTKNGRLPNNIPENLPIYKFKQPRFSYEAGKNARDDAGILGYTDKDLTSDLKGTKYSWRSLSSNGVLDIKIDTRELTSYTPLAGRSDNFPAGRITLGDASAIAKGLFSSLGRLDSDKLYAEGTQTAYLGKFVGSVILETRLQSEAQIARVELFRKINGYPIYGPDPKKGLLRAYVKFYDQQNPLYNYPIVEAYFWEIDTQTNATYPIIPVEDAWEAISKGEGVIANVSPKANGPFQEYTPIKVEKVLINNIYIAYFDNYVLQKFLQPIYVFEGNYTTGGTPGGDITLYFPAVQGQWVKPANTETPVTK